MRLRSSRLVRTDFVGIQKSPNGEYWFVYADLVDELYIDEAGMPCSMCTYSYRYLPAWDFDDKMGGSDIGEDGVKRDE